MKFKDYTLIWLLITVILGLEWLLLSFDPEHSLLTLFQKKKLIHDFSISPKAGAPISYFLGWLGLSFILMTNGYILRRRVRWAQNWGSMRGWLDFHIFCGMIGPTLILFHANFHSRGLVSLTYWSMIIVAVSGLVGRYFYIKVVTEEKDSDRRVLHYLQKINTYAESVSTQERARIEASKSKALNFMGVPLKYQSLTPSALQALQYSLWGDLRSLFFKSQFRVETSGALRSDLLKWAYFLRKKHYLRPFQMLLGYWHAFHLPFAILMYVTVLFHIVAATLFRNSTQ